MSRRIRQAGMPLGPIKNRRSASLRRPGIRSCRHAPGSLYRRVIGVGSYWWVEGNSLQHSGLFGVERGKDFFREEFEAWKISTPQDIPRIAALDGDAWKISMDRAISPSSQTR